ncbi:uncharacterized protein TNCV_4678891 [Trichonephila clavipes]|nr:uncharacterized protein TNCV_4678891 [Trichonephila clavipes]
MSLLEEIGLAVKELEDHNASLLSDESLDWKNLNDTLILPPQAFRSDDCYNKTNNGTEVSKIIIDNSPSVNRVCYDGNILDFGYPFTKFSSSSNPVSRTSFASSFSPGITAKNGKTAYSPNTRRKLWRMHPSISFPETSKDLLLLSKDSNNSLSLSNSECNKKSSNGWAEQTIENDSAFRTLPNAGQKYRQRSNSDTAAASLSYSYVRPREHTQDESNAFPRPPSGDVNLLSIWADNLVLELDKRLSGELMNSSESFSPTSDYSLSPTKHEENVESSNFANKEKSASMESNLLSFSGLNLKSVSRSPDSGIEQVPDMCVPEDCVDSVGISNTKEDLNSGLLISATPNSENITPPPPGFNDENKGIKDRSLSQATQTDKYICRRPSCLKSAEYIFETYETTEPLNSDQNSVSLAQVIPSKTIFELEISPLVRTVCVVNDVSVVNSNPKMHEKMPSNGVEAKNREQPHTFSMYPYTQICPIFSSLPKPPKTAPCTAEKWNSLPFRASQSAVSNVNYVVMCCKILNMRHVMGICMKIVNSIRGRSLQIRMFRAHLEENESDYGELLYDADVRWLSRSIFLQRFRDPPQEKFGDRSTFSCVIYTQKQFRIMMSVYLSPHVVSKCDRGQRVMSSFLVPLKQRCIEGVLYVKSLVLPLVWYGSLDSGVPAQVRPRHLTMIQNYEVRRQ